MITKEPSGQSTLTTDAGERCSPRDQRGAALIGTVFAVVIMSMVGMVSVNLAVEEISHTNNAKDAAVARYLAEAGADVAVQWFHDPGAAPLGLDSQLFAKRFLLPSGPSFFDAEGRSQFTGTAEHPDVVVDAAHPLDDRLLHDPSKGWFRGLLGLGRILKMKVYRPSRSGALCTVELVVSAGARTRSFSFQLGAHPLPTLQSGMQIGVREPSHLSHDPFKPWVHWADVKVKGDLRLPSLPNVPAKTLHAPVSGQSYADMTHQADRWLEIRVGGEAVLSGGTDGQQNEPMPVNVFLQQDPVPGLQLDQWSYETMKGQALKYGNYYTMDHAGLLYLDGKIAPGLGLRADQVFNPEHGFSNMGLVFVDTLDQRPPAADNLGALSIESDYLEGAFVINAHLHFKPKGGGSSIRVLSPPLAQTASAHTEVREPVQLTGIHLNGVLYVAGHLLYEGSPRIHGAVMSGRQIAAGSSTAGPLELWYNHDLHSGLIQGLPLVFIVPGSIQEST